MLVNKIQSTRIKIWVPIIIILGTKKDFYRVDTSYKTTENSPFVKGTICFNALPQKIKMQIF